MPQIVSDRIRRARRVKLGDTMSLDTDGRGRGVGDGVICQLLTSASTCLVYKLRGGGFLTSEDALNHYRYIFGI